MTESKQLFFRPDEFEAAVAEARKTSQWLCQIVDRRPKNPKPLMYFLGGVPTFEQMCKHKMCKRMWEARDVRISR
jgi:hypothetical protein